MFDGQGVWTTALGDRFEGQLRAGQFHGALRAQPAVC